MNEGEEKEGKGRWERRIERNSCMAPYTGTRLNVQGWNHDMAGESVEMRTAECTSAAAPALGF